MVNKLFLTVSEAAKFLSLSQPSVLELTKNGRLAFVMKKMDTVPFRNARYIPISELEALKTQRSTFGKSPQGYITCESAANYYGLHSTTIRFMAYDGRINSIRALGKHGQSTVYIEKSSLENYIQERTASSDLVDRFFVAALLGVTSQTVQKWARKNRIPFVRVKRMGGEHRLYPKEEIEKLLRSISETPNIPEDFGYYLSGLADGEGSFMLSVRSRMQVIQNEASFKISLRNDDLPILVLIRKTLGFGRLYSRRIGTMHEQSGWETNRHIDAARLVHIFDKYPLRAKKARDYKIWREFVLERARPDRSQARLNQLADEIVKVREYHPPSQELTNEVKELNDNQQFFHFKSLGTGVHS